MLTPQKTFAMMNGGMVPAISRNYSIRSDTNPVSLLNVHYTGGNKIVSRPTELQITGDDVDNYAIMGKFPTTLNDYLFNPRLRIDSAFMSLIYLGTGSTDTGVQTHETIIEADEDAYIQDSVLDGNYGSLEKLWVGRGSSEQAAIYLSFPWWETFYQGWAGGTIVSAKLRLYPYDDPNDYPNATINHLDFAIPEAAWDEGSITWNNRPRNLAGAPIEELTYVNANPLEKDITSIFNYWRTNGNTNGVRIYQDVSTTQTRKYFRSSEYATAGVRPQLVVTWTSGGNPAPKPPDLNVWTLAGNWDPATLADNFTIADTIPTTNAIIGISSNYAQWDVKNICQLWKTHGQQYGILINNGGNATDKLERIYQVLLSMRFK